MFQQFRVALNGQYSFGIQHIKMLFPDFNSKNLTFWQKKGYLIKLRSGLYTFSDYKSESGIALHFANQIYQPSYISLHSALNFYGIIPEIPSSITSVCTPKTQRFENPFGQFTYQTVQPLRFFGYKSLNAGKWSVRIAEPEKAIIDLFYLYPMYNSPEEIALLRFDEDILPKIVRRKVLNSYAERMQSLALQKRVNHLIKTYEL